MSKCKATGCNHRTREEYCPWCRAQFLLNHKPQESDKDRANRLEQSLVKVKAIGIELLDWMESSPVTWHGLKEKRKELEAIK